MANASTDLDNAEAQRQFNNNNRPASTPEQAWDVESTTARLFECSRIRALADIYERDAVQKKTFTKWVNSHLARVACRIADLYNDLRDGYMLTRLLEVLSGEQLPKPTRGRMRIHCLENVDKALTFLKEQRVHLENVGSHDIVDGNHRLSLGLIWTIILRFQKAQLFSWYHLRFRLVERRVNESSPGLFFPSLSGEVMRCGVMQPGIRLPSGERRRSAMANASTDLDNAEAQRQFNNNNRPASTPEQAWDVESTTARLFECSRIRALADERDAVQKKTFTKWVNSHLARVACRIADLYNDLRDGYMLTRLLEVLSGEQLIQVIKIETEDNRETRSAKDALLLWCQMKTAGYPEVSIQNFTTSWRDGLAFNALIHKHRPDLIEFSKLTKSNATHNLQQAFNSAEQHLGLTKLLDPEGERRRSAMANASTDLDNAEAQRQFNNNNRPASTPEQAWDVESTTARLFECSRIRALADERDAVQKKTFTKWVNSHLARVACRIADLYNDLRDGYMLTRLLEVLSGEQLPKPTRGRMRIHCLENVDKALTFLKEQRVHLENVGSHDIVDGNHRLSLGLIWTIILRFQVLDKALETEKIIERYEVLASDLLEWIEKTIGIISNQKFANSLVGVQQQLQAFTTYCTIEKPIK
ncbi:UNVERIFIED_CONTAM: hypothetical protein FKN15_020717 [Acipenser sinensis]